METANKVFVVQENPHLDYTDAERFGEVEFVTNVEYSSMQNSLNNINVIRDVQRAMSRFDPRRDYILLTGNPVTIGYTFHLALMATARETNNASVRCLRWDGITRQYQSIDFKY